MPRPLGYGIDARPQLAIVLLEIFDAALKGRGDVERDLELRIVEHAHDAEHVEVILVDRMLDLLDVDPAELDPPVEEGAARRAPTGDGRVPNSDQCSTHRRRAPSSAGSRGPCARRGAEARRSVYVRVESRALEEI